jgi:3-hydroxybutyryl-CoA dehydratase
MDKTTNPLVDLNGYYFEDLKVGIIDEFSKKISGADIQTFAEISGDENPVHLNPEYAKGTVFKGCIAHGILTASLISTVIGTRMPGPGCIYVAQNLKFKTPVWAGDMVKAVCTVTELNKTQNLAEIKTQCFVGDTMVIDGNATIMVPSRG